MPGLIEFNVRASGRPSNPPVLLLHGFMGSALDWDEIARMLSDDFYLAALDLPGHGGTEVGDESGYRMDTCAEAVIEWLDRGSIRTCSLIGYSMGGRLALHLAVTHPERFDSVVIEAASPGLGTEAEREDRLRSDALRIDMLRGGFLSEFLEEWYRQPMFASIRENERQFGQMIERRLQNDPRKLALSLQYMGAGAQEPLWDRLGQISARVLLVAGEHDVKYRRVLDQASVLLKQGRQVIVPDAGHNTHLENPEAFVTHINNFLCK